MNTFDTTHPRIGLIELPHLAQALESGGLQVVTGPDFRSAAKEISKALKEGGPYPIITDDKAAPGLRAWIDRIRATGPVPVAVVRNPEDQVITSAGVVELQRTHTVDNLLAAVGLPPIGGAAGATLLYPAAEDGWADLDFDIDDLVEEEEAVAAPVPAAATAAPTGRRAAAPADNSPVRDPARQAAPAPAQDDWDTPAAPAPAPAAPAADDWGTAPAPAPAAAASWDDDDDWGTPAPTAAPAAPASFDDWDTPAAPAPAAAQATGGWDTSADDDGWDTPAPDEGWDAPAAPVSSPAAELEDTWEMPDFDELPGPEPVAAAPASTGWGADQFEPPQAGFTFPAAADAVGQDDFATWDTPAPAAPAAAEDFMAWDGPSPAAPVQQRPAPVPVPAPAPVPVAAPAAPAGQSFSDPVDQLWDTPPAAAAVPAGPPAPSPFDAPVRPARPVEDDAAAIFDEFESSKLQGTGRTAAGLGALVFPFSGKGGVGKSTTSLMLAKLAADAGLRVVLIDGNSGQGDLRTYLRLNRTNLPTIYDAGIGSIKTSVLTPDTINAHRDESLGRVNFAFVAAPPDDINDPRIITEGLYRNVIEFARRNADIVIVDTQIVESADRTGVVNNLILPALKHDAWGIGVSDMTSTGVNNLNNRLRMFLNEGVPNDRLMVMVNRVHPEQMEAAVKTVDYFRNRALHLGAVEMDPEVGGEMNAGRTQIGNTGLIQVYSKALLRITGNEAFRAGAEGPAEETRSGGFLAKMFGGRKK